MKRAWLAAMIAVAMWALPARAQDCSTSLNGYPAIYGTHPGDDAILHREGSGGPATLVVYFHGWRNCIKNVAYGGADKNGRAPAGICGSSGAPDAERKGLIKVYNDSKAVPG